MQSFREKLEARVKAVDSLLCVGLDPHEKELFSQGWEGIDEETRCDAAFTFCKTLVDATLPHTCCYKPNAAFFEALGDQGASVLRRVCKEVIPDDVPILLDVKRGDIGSTAAAYAEACYNIGADCVTLSPLMGWDSVSPFVADGYSTKGAFLLCKTSNPGSNDLLAITLQSSESLFERIAKLVGKEWSLKTDASLGLVVGATDPVALKKARDAAGENVWILAPGVGAQGGDLLEAAKAGLNSAASNMIIPVSRGISRAESPGDAARELKEKIQLVRAQIQAESAAESSEGAIMPYQKDFIEFSLSQGVLKFGSFVLKSGRTSPYFFNAGLFASGAALYKLGNAYAASIMSSPELVSDGNVKFDVIFGPAYKGISLGAVVSSALYSNYGLDVGFAYDRKEAKDHGEGGKLVGASLEGNKVLIVDDVITAGTAIRESHTMLQTVGAQPVGVVIALDRAEIRSTEDKISAVQAVSRDLSLSVVSIVNLPQLQTFLEGNSDFTSDTLQQVIDYRSKYGV